jgi:hypothetical protein
MVVDNCFGAYCGSRDRFVMGFERTVSNFRATAARAIQGPRVDELSGTGPVDGVGVYTSVDKRCAEMSENSSALA